MNKHGGGNREIFRREQARVPFGFQAALSAEAVSSLSRTLFVWWLVGETNAGSALDLNGCHCWGRVHLQSGEGFDANACR